ncbi:hypothetical protein HELRODRAFT_192188 [Helobdella robusta]|uniref:Intraflagellar transport protein 57 homolog n=1 Tax=Helobdella robusta TaxID=6412 RepID=T1FTN8_HELRO|nr:hypothetical protein HELRODRAFT_192188 [Helobdella robusta]ESO01572.1 hypothetical protein HELRODRAFT_192188 [Helobdella robusta]
MSDSENKKKSGDVIYEEGPGAAYQTFVIMEELLDKLKLLNYEDGYCKRLSNKPISRHFFALPTNPGEQFYAFSTLSAWLLKMCGKSFDQPQEHDDPNGIISNILDELRQMNHNPDFPPNRLKSGCGEQCLWVIDRLADEALKFQKFSWKRPIYPQDHLDEGKAMDDGEEEEADLNLFKADNELDLADDDDDDDEHALILDHLTDNFQAASGDSKNISQGFSGSENPQQIMESNTDVAEWKMEVERVLPQLKITIRPDNKDWRVHFEQMQTFKSGMADSLKDVQQHLGRLTHDITKSLEKISNREKYLNGQLDGRLQEYRVKQDQLSEIKEQYKLAGAGVTERSRTLAEITDDLERIKQEMEERGSSMSDGTPLVRIKQAMTQIKEECLHMDVRIGVLQHILLRAKLKERNIQNSLMLNQSSLIAVDEDDIINNEFQGY